MERPKKVTVTVQWTNENGEEVSSEFNENSLEEAHDMIGLMIGDIGEEDLQP